MVQDLLERIKIAANKRDVPYQSLIKVWLAEVREHHRGGDHQVDAGHQRVVTPLQGVQRRPGEASGSDRRAASIERYRD